MKTNKSVIALSVFIGLMLVSCNTEQPGIGQVVSKPDSVYVYKLSADGQETLNSITYYTYDAAKNNTCILTYSDFYWPGEMKRTQIDMQYNAKGQIVLQKEYHYYTMNDTMPFDFRKYIYGTDNKLVMYYWAENWDERIDDGVWEKKEVFSWVDDTHAETTTYNYNRQAKSDEDLWYVAGRSVMTYTAFGAPERMEYYLLLPYAKQSDTPDLIHEYSYDHYGNIIYFTRYSDDCLVSKQYNKYDYDKSGRILVKWQCSNTGGDDTGTFDYKSVYYY